MASDLLYHVTPTANLNSIQGNGLMPKAGKWYGPREVADDDLPRVAKLLRQAFRNFSIESDGEGYVNLRGRFWESDVKALGRLGFRLNGRPPVHEWSPCIFLCTSKMAAYWIAFEFSLDGHHGSQPLSILTVYRNAVPGTISSDPYIPTISAEDRRARKWRKRRGAAIIPTATSPRNMVLGEGVTRRQRLGSVMTETAIPPSALASFCKAPDDPTVISEFRRWMGMMTYEKSDWKWRLRH